MMGDRPGSADLPLTGQGLQVPVDHAISQYLPNLIKKKAIDLNIAEDTGRDEHSSSSLSRWDEKSIHSKSKHKTSRLEDGGEVKHAQTTAGLSAAEKFSKFKKQREAAKDEDKVVDHMFKDFITSKMKEIENGNGEDKKLKSKSRKGSKTNSMQEMTKFLDSEISSITVKNSKDDSNSGSNNAAVSFQAVTAPPPVPTPTPVSPEAFGPMLPPITVKREKEDYEELKVDAKKPAFGFKNFGIKLSVVSKELIQSGEIHKKGKRLEEGEVLSSSNSEDDSDSTDNEVDVDDDDGNDDEVSGTGSLSDTDDESKSKKKKKKKKKGKHKKKKKHKEKDKSKRIKVEKETADEDKSKDDKDQTKSEMVIVVDDKAGVKRKVSMGSKSRSRSPKRSKRSNSKEKVKISGSKDRSKRSVSKDRKRSRSRDRKRARSKDRKRSVSKERKRSRSRDRKRSRSRERRRSRSKDRKRSRSKDRKRSRSKDRKRSRSKDRKRSRSKDRSKRSRSKDRSKKSRSRSPKRNRSKRSTSRSRGRRSRSRGRRSRSRDRRKSRSPDRFWRSKYGDFDAFQYSKRRRSRSRTRSPDRESEKFKEKERKRIEDLRGRIDKAKLREIAIKNALSSAKAGGAQLDVTIKAGGKSVEELTEYCKRIQDQEKEKRRLRGVYESSSEEEPARMSDEEDLHHPFKMKEPAPIVMDIKNAKQLPVVTPQERLIQSGQLRLQFPVSSGSHHRDKEWVPVEKEEPVAKKPGPVAIYNPAGPSTPVAPVQVKPKQEVKVFEEPTMSSVDITSIISERLSAVRQLAENPNDVYAKAILSKAQMKASQWAQSKNLPGQFLGSTGASILSQQELAGDKRHQAWARKDVFTNAAPVRGGIGMALLQKMGWKQGTGLGKNNEGKVEPLMLDVKIDRKGLVTHGEGKKKASAPQLPVMRDLSSKHPVSALGELCNKRRWGAPIFDVVHESGPAHKRDFLYKVRVNGTEYQPAVASNNKKLAKAACATFCLQELGLVPRT